MDPHSISILVLSIRTGNFKKIISRNGKFVTNKSSNMNNAAALRVYMFSPAMENPLNKKYYLYS